jgi:uncharacterized protein (TIGR02646 family)
MRRLVRRSLSAETSAWLAAQAADIAAAPDPGAEARQRWENRQRNRFMEEVWEKLLASASGLARCMYCEDSGGTAIDHFWPKARYPERTFSWENHLLACTCCNSNEKRDQFPLDAAGAPLLLDPTACDPADHLILTPSTGKYRPKDGSPKGEASIEVFGLNRRTDLVKGRKNVWVGLEGVLILYGQARAEGNATLARKCKDHIRQHPFSAVWAHFLRVARHPSAKRSIVADCRAVLEQFDEIFTWGAD